MTEDQALIPVEERTILFYHDEIKRVCVTRTPSGRLKYDQEL